MKLEDIAQENIELYEEFVGCGIEYVGDVILTKPSANDMKNKILECAKKINLRYPGTIDINNIDSFVGDYVFGLYNQRKRA